MTKDQMNALRPSDRIRMTTATTTWSGTVLSIWSDDTVTIRWSDGVVDTLPITADNAKGLEK